MKRHRAKGWKAYTDASTQMLLYIVPPLRISPSFASHETSSEQECPDLVDADFGREYVRSCEKSIGARLHFGCVARPLIYLKPNAMSEVVELEVRESGKCTLGLGNFTDLDLILLGRNSPNGRRIFEVMIRYARGHLWKER